MTESKEDKVYSPVRTKGINKGFPKVVILIVFNEFCERFSYSGMRAFLALYLKQKLFYSDDEATEIYHVFTTMAYFFPVFGAILADSYIGKFRTILYLMVVYAVGNVMLAITAIPPLGIPGREFTLLGLLLVSVGTGGIKPCVSAFGGDQFIMPEQEKQLTAFFSFFYFALCVGSLIAKTVSPLLRSEIHCFGDKDCYSVGFGAPGILILTSIVSFACAKRMYIIKKPTGNIVLDVMKCITLAIKNRLSSKGEKKKSHWLDYARESYDQSFIDDVKKTLRIFVLFTPLPVYWSLLDQLGSRWTLQATKMDGRFFFFTVKPDQMQVLSPIMVLLMIPILKNGVYPILERCGILRHPLHKLIAGCVLAGVAFICTGVLEINLEKTYPVLPSNGLGQLRMFNGRNCDLMFADQTTGENFTIEPLGFHENMFVEVIGKKEILYKKTSICSNHIEVSEERIQVEENKAISYLFKDEDEFGDSVLKYRDYNAKSRSGFPYIRILANTRIDEDAEIVLYNLNRDMVEFTSNTSRTNLTDVFAGDYQLYVNNKMVLPDFRLNIGGVYTIIVNEENDEFGANILTITEPNSVSMAWVLPQMIVISTSEVLFAITGLEFAFKEAPESMKSVLQAYWYLVEAFGNILIIVITRAGSNYRQVTQFFFYACLMFVSTIAFYALTRRHRRLKLLVSEEINEKRLLQANVES